MKAGSRCANNSYSNRQLHVSLVTLMFSHVFESDAGNLSWWMVKFTCLIRDDRN